MKFQPKLIKCLLTLIILLQSVFVFADTSIPKNASYHLDSTATISLLTCAAGTEVYSTFGHSALFVYDTVNKIQKVYNYGTFSYGDDFLYKFLKGDLDYFLSVTNLEEFMYEYENEGRAVTEQILNLDQSQKEKLYTLLEINNRPENRVYHYDFLFDNCSTRLRDILEKATDGKLNYDYSFINMNDKTKDQSYREMIDERAGHLKWLTFGMDLMIGVPSDKTAKPREHLFLPDNLMNAYFFATLKDGQKSRPLVKKTSALLNYKEIKTATPFFESPLFFSLIFFLMVFIITFISYKQNRSYKGFDIIFTFLFSMIGFLFLFMWTSTRHHVAYMNLNILWANPLLILMCILFFTKKYRAISVLALIYSLICIVLVFSWRWLLPQDFNIAMFPFFIALALRAAYVYFYYNKKAQKVSKRR